MRRRRAERHSGSGSPTIRSAPTSTGAEDEYSSSHSLCLADRIAHDGNEQVGDAGSTHLAQCGELVAIDTIEQQDAAAEHLALVDRPERPRCSEVLSIHHHFDIAGLEVLHAAGKDL